MLALPFCATNIVHSDQALNHGIMLCLAERLATAKLLDGGRVIRGYHVRIKPGVRVGSCCDKGIRLLRGKTEDVMRERAIKREKQVRMATIARQIK